MEKHQIAITLVFAFLFFLLYIRRLYKDTKPRKRYEKEKLVPWVYSLTQGWIAKPKEKIEARDPGKIKGNIYYGGFHFSPRWDKYQASKKIN